MTSDHAGARNRMVESQIAGRDVRDSRVIEAMRTVPREAFVQEGYEEYAYDDTPLPIGEGQTISQPYVVALMIEAAGIEPRETVLEIGAGSGYAVAVMGQIAKRVIGIERHPRLAEAASARLEALGYGNCTVEAGDGTLGRPDEAPFDAIIVSAGGPDVPTALKQQLSVGGRLVMPIGTDERHQTLVRVTRTGDDAFEQEALAAVAFVPLIGEQGWTEGGR